MIIILHHIRGVLFLYDCSKTTWKPNFMGQKWHWTAEKMHDSDAMSRVEGHWKRLSGLGIWQLLCDKLHIRTTFHVWNIDLYIYHIWTGGSDFRRLSNKIKQFPHVWKQMQVHACNLLVWVGPNIVWYRQFSLPSRRFYGFVTGFSPTDFRLGWLHD